MFFLFFFFLSFSSWIASPQILNHAIDKRQMCIRLYLGASISVKKVNGALNVFFAIYGRQTEEYIKHATKWRKRDRNEIKRSNRLTKKKWVIVPTTGCSSTWNTNSEYSHRFMWIDSSTLLDISYKQFEWIDCVYIQHWSGWDLRFCIDLHWSSWQANEERCIHSINENSNNKFDSKLLFLIETRAHDAIRVAMVIIFISLNKLLCEATTIP